MGDLTKEELERESLDAAYVRCLTNLFVAYFEDPGTPPNMDRIANGLTRARIQYEQIKILQSRP